MNVLVVDDEPLARERMLALLAQIDGIQVVGESGNGREALEMAARLHPDLILLDIRMPVMDGLMLLSRVSVLPRLTKTVIVSAYDDLENIRTAMNRGAYDFLTKPIDFGATPVSGATVTATATGAATARTARLAGCAAIGAPAGFVGEAFAGEEFLLAGRECELTSTINTGQRFIGIHISNESPSF